MAQQLRITYFRDGEVFVVDAHSVRGLSEKRFEQVYGTPKTSAKALKALADVKRFELDFDAKPLHEQNKTVAEYLWHQETLLHTS